MTDKKKISQPSLRNLASGDVLFREGEVGDFAFNSTTIYLPPNLKKDAIEDILKDEKS